MGKIKLPYYRVKKGRGYWMPTPRMKSLGFGNICCGPDGPEAWATAEQYNERWQRTRRGEMPPPAEQERRNLSPDQAEELAIYPASSVGEAFRRYRKTEEWARKGERTREDWWRGWKHIKPVFADVAPATVNLEQISKWRGAIEARHGLNTAHRALKIWRALWKVMAAYHLCLRDADPSLGVRNTSPKGRSATWSEGEVVRLVKRAWRAGYHGAACIVAAAWDTQFSPVDARTLVLRQARRDARGFFSCGRGRRRDR